MLTMTDAQLEHLEQTSHDDLILALARCAIAERAARKAAAADNAMIRQMLINWINADGGRAFADEDERLADLAKQLRDDLTHPGAALLAELEAARTRLQAIAELRRTAWDGQMFMRLYDGILKG